MSKDLQQLVDFTSSECLNLFFKPVLLGEYGSLGVHPIDAIITDDTLILGNEHISLESITNIEYGYISDDYEDRIEKVSVNSILDVEKYIMRKRIPMTSSGFRRVSHGTYFPFYQADKIGSGYVIIETTNGVHEIIYPTKTITCEKEQ